MAASGGGDCGGIEIVFYLLGAGFYGIYNFSKHCYGFCTESSKFFHFFNAVTHLGSMGGGCYGGVYLGGILGSLSPLGPGLGTIVGAVIGGIIGCGIGVGVALIIESITDCFNLKSRERARFNPPETPEPVITHTRLSSTAQSQQKLNMNPSQSVQASAPRPDDDPPPAYEETSGLTSTTNGVVPISSDAPPAFNPAYTS